MPIEHRRRAVEWFLLVHEIPMGHAHRHTTRPAPAPARSEPNEPIGPALYDTGLDTNEGLWHRTGWLRNR